MPRQLVSDNSTATAMQRPLNQLSADASVSGGSEPQVCTQRLPRGQGCKSNKGTEVAW